MPKELKKMKKFSFLFTLSLIFTFHVSAQNLKTAITSIGCKQIKISDVKPMKISQAEFETWQKDKFQIQSKQSFIAKCRAKDGLFYRVLFEEETYSNQSIAAARLPKIEELPPKEDDKSEVAVPILLREGFQVKNKIYTVGNFAYGVYLEGDVKIWRDKLQKKIR
jgi:hypothetical protein